MFEKGLSLISLAFLRCLFKAPNFAWKKKLKNKTYSYTKFPPISFVQKENQNKKVYEKQF